MLLVVGTADDPVTADADAPGRGVGPDAFGWEPGRGPPAGRGRPRRVAGGADAGLAARSGDVVLLYHLLWELTHVVFEHPGLLTDEPAVH